ncbi:hypothetical protein GJ496_002139 [Pomphorhynchus laevis]|nr:hypothetical protein GJ496_002139 [Pomphorhynchus laevis]
MTGGLYTGRLGAVYAANKVLTFENIRQLFNQDEINQIVYFCENSIKHIEAEYDRRRGISRSDMLSFFFGPAGLYFTAIIYYHTTTNSSKVNEYQSKLSRFIDQNLNYMKDFEVLYGIAGVLALFRDLERFNLQIPRQDEISFTICKNLLKEGSADAQKYNKSTHRSLKLSFPFCNLRYIGAAHGLSFILQMMLRHFDRFEENERKLIQAAIDDILQLQTPEGNFPSCLEDIGKECELVHWCHGAPGVIYLMASAFQKLREDKYLQSCILSADLVWKFGLLKKGPGLCHGISGNGYVFLLMYRLTGDKKYYYMALGFAHFMALPVFTQSVLMKPDNPFSLFEGMAGQVCFLCDIVNPIHSYFPFTDI